MEEPISSVNNENVTIL